MIKANDLSMVRELYLDEVVDILREDGIIIGRVVMSWSRLIKRCHLYDVDPGRVLNFIS